MDGCITSTVSHVLNTSDGQIEIGATANAEPPFQERSTRYDTRCGRTGFFRIDHVCPALPTLMQKR
jgi:hypothetical protein